MAGRYPASLRSVKSDRSLRRRSGTFSNSLEEDRPESDSARAPSRTSTRASSSSVVSSKSRRMSTIVEYGDATSSQSHGPSFRRVSAIKDAPLPPLPKPSPNPGSDRFFGPGPDNLHPYGRWDDRLQPFSDIPLTPVQRSPDLERDGNAFSPYLPTPNFSRQNSIRSRFSIPKLSRAVSRRRSSKNSDFTIALRTEINDWKSDVGNLARNRPPLIPGSSSNWTQKWPKPRLSPRSLGGLIAAIEESSGLGIEKPDRWTTHKWVLLMTILIAFGYSSVGLAYAMLTWFRGEGFHFPTLRFLNLQQGGKMRR